MTFNEWLDETEYMSTRWHRFLEEYECGMMDVRRTKQWLEAAYRQGFEEGYKSPQAPIDEVV
jgi:hypothetical protein